MKSTRYIRNAVLLWICSTGMTCPEGAEVTSSFGYINLTPPSTLYVPGAILAVEPREDGTIDMSSLRLCCGPRAALGAAWLPTVSQTISQQSRLQGRKSWHLSGDLLNQVRNTTKVEAIQDIEVSLTDMKILSMSDTDLLLASAYRTPECRKAVLSRLAAGHQLTMVSEALVADMTYSVTFRDQGKVDARARSKQMSAVAVSLGGGFQSISSKKIVARGLAIGIKTDSFLMQLGFPELEGGKPLGVDDDALAQELSATNTTAPDAPVVMPAGYSPSPVFEP